MEEYHVAILSLKYVLNTDFVFDKNGIFCSSHRGMVWVYIEVWPETRSYLPEIRSCLPEGRRPKGKLDHG